MTGVEVNEPPIPARVRRPADVLRLATAVLVIVLSVTLADLAVGTADALEGDLSLATGSLPRLLLTLLGWAGGVGVIALPVALSTELVVRGRLRQLVEAAVAAAAATGVVSGFGWFVDRVDAAAVVGALTRPMGQTRTELLDVVIVALMAFLTVARMRGRRWHRIPAVLVIGSSMITSFLGGVCTALALGISLVLGWAVGLAVRLALGAVSTMPSGQAIAEALLSAGVNVTRMDFVEAAGNRDGGERVYRATGPDGELDVSAIDRDTFGIATMQDMLHRVRLRGASARRPALSVAAEVEHRVMLALTYEHAGIPAPRLRAAVPIGPSSSVVALTPSDGQTLADTDQVTDAQLEGLWGMLLRLQVAHVAHRQLGPRSVLVSPVVGLAAIGDGDVGADDLPLRLDLARMLVSVAVTTGAERAVRTAAAVLGAERVQRAIPLLQPIALGQEVRATVKGYDGKRRPATAPRDGHAGQPVQQPGLLEELRERLVALEPDQAAPKAIELRRVTLQTILTMIGGGFAAYLVLSMLASVDVGRLAASASWPWALACAGCAALTFAGTSLAIMGAVDRRLSFVRTYMAQLVVAFSGLVAPGLVGNVAVNTRYLVCAKIPPAAAATAVALVQVIQMMSYFLLLITTGVLAGTRTQASFTPPPALVGAVPVVVVLVVGLLTVPKARAFLAARVMPHVRVVVPQIVGAFQHPARLARMLGGALLLDVSFVGALVCATRAFGADPSTAAVAIVYFAGAIIGSAVPTPGGLGGIEAAMSAGLVAIGVDTGVAVSSVLLYRLATYWLPIPFGWLSSGSLQRARLL